MRCGEDYFLLSRSGYHTPPNRGTDTLIHHAFMIDGDAFDAALAHVEASGVEVLLYEDKGHRSFTGRHAYFNDPDGNTIEFIDFQGVGDITAADYEGRERRRAKAHVEGKISVAKDNVHAQAENKTIFSPRPVPARRWAQLFRSYWLPAHAGERTAGERLSAGAGEAPVASG